jgi:hypothetical protein
MDQRAGLGIGAIQPSSRPAQVDREGLIGIDVGVDLLLALASKVMPAFVSGEMALKSR